MIPPATASPLISAAELAAHGADLPVPQPHTDAELNTVLALLATQKPQVEAVTIGHGRDHASVAAAEAFAAAWTMHGGTILAVVDWPETAASWLRPATRLTAQRPDAWVIAAGLRGFAQLARRLRRSTDFDPARAVAFASLDDTRLITLAGPDAVNGLHGADADGRIWSVRHGRIAS